MALRAAWIAIMETRRIFTRNTPHRCKVNLVIDMIGEIWENGSGLYLEIPPTEASQSNSIRIWTYNKVEVLHISHYWDEPMRDIARRLMPNEQAKWLWVAAVREVIMKEQILNKLLSYSTVIVGCLERIQKYLLLTIRMFKSYS